jgi:hypothetical protein
MSSAVGAADGRFERGTSLWWLEAALDATGATAADGATGAATTADGVAETTADGGATMGEAEGAGVTAAGEVGSARAIEEPEELEGDGGDVAPTAEGAPREGTHTTNSAAAVTTAAVTPTAPAMSPARPVRFSPVTRFESHAEGVFAALAALWASTLFHVRAVSRTGGDGMGSGLAHVIAMRARSAMTLDAGGASGSSAVASSDASA